MVKDPQHQDRLLVKQLKSMTTGPTIPITMDVVQLDNPSTVLNNDSGHRCTRENLPLEDISNQSCLFGTSTTETLFDWVWDKVVGITRYCVHPTCALTEKTIVGGTKQCNMNKLVELQPDLVLCNQEENTPDIVHAIEELGVDVYVAFPKTHADALVDLQNLGSIFDQEKKVDKWTGTFLAKTSDVSPSPFTYIYLIWRKPWMAVGKDTFIARQLELIGGQNQLSTHPERYITLESADLQQANTHILLSSEPYPFEEKHIQELLDLGIDRTRIHFIDGEYCSWHGVRMIESIEYLQAWKDQYIS